MFSIRLLSLKSGSLRIHESDACLNYHSAVFGSVRIRDTTVPNLSQADI